MQFDLLKTDEATSARAGTITTAHGTIETPIFMPVGTVATVVAAALCDVAAAAAPYVSHRSSREPAPPPWPC